VVDAGAAFSSPSAVGNCCGGIKRCDIVSGCDIVWRPLSLIWSTIVYTVVVSTFSAHKVAPTTKQNADSDIRFTNSIGKILLRLQK
jgi:hypothetical protein